jgi:DNA-binding response OmpR family regulator
LAEKKPVLLVVEDDLDVAEMLNAYFNVQGYQVHCVHWGQDALLFCGQSRPDLMILDIRLPDLDGYEIARRLRSHTRTKDIPIIFLTEKRSRADKLHGLELGADDYLTKPFDIQELRLRVRNALNRAKQGTLSNPVTGLPEGVLVQEKIVECLARENWEMLYFSLENLDLFKETYGFVASDDVLRAINHIIQNTIREQDNALDFLGQLAPTGFLLISFARDLFELRNCITSRIEQSFDFFYPLKDRLAGRSKTTQLMLKSRQLSSKNGPYESYSVVMENLLG